MKKFKDKIYIFLFSKRHHFLIGAFLLALLGSHIPEWVYGNYIDYWDSVYKYNDTNSVLYFNPYSWPWHNLRWNIFDAERLFFACSFWLIIYERIFKKILFVYFLHALNIFQDRAIFNEHEFGLNDWFAYGCIVLYLLNILFSYANRG